MDSFEERLGSSGIKIIVINNEYPFVGERSLLRFSSSERVVYWRSAPTPCGLKLDFMKNATIKNEDVRALCIHFSCPTSNLEEDDSIVVTAKFSDASDATTAKDFLIFDF